MTSDTPAPASSGARRGRPPRSEAERAAERRRVAHEALRLFAERGLAATSADDVARAAGVSVRTFWRLVRAKEDAVRPLLEDAVGVIAANVRARGLAGFRATGEAGSDASTAPAELEEARTLVRLTRTEPALRAVWLDVHDAAETVFADALAASRGDDGAGLASRATAAVVNAALRVAVEEWAWHEPALPASAYGRLVGEALRLAVDGLRDVARGAAATAPGEARGPRAD